MNHDDRYAAVLVFGRHLYLGGAGAAGGQDEGNCHNYGRIQAFYLTAHTHEW